MPLKGAKGLYNRPILETAPNHKGHTQPDYFIPIAGKEIRHQRTQLRHGLQSRICRILPTRGASILSRGEAERPHLPEHQADQTGRSVLRKGSVCNHLPETKQDRLRSPWRYCCPHCLPRLYLPRRRAAVPLGTRTPARVSPAFSAHKRRLHTRHCHKGIGKQAPEGGSITGRLSRPQFPEGASSGGSQQRPNTGKNPDA